jgi:tetratricopeptide (TPR) repeat protein
MRAILCSVVVALLIAGEPVNAFGADDVDSAREHFSKGKKLYDVGRFAEAATEYELAYQAKDDPALLFNLGQAYRLAGNSAKAILAYRAYLRNTSAAPNQVEVENWIHELQAAQAQLHEPKATPPTHADGPTTAANTPSSNRLALSASAPSTNRKPIYKRWWPWTIASVVLAGAAVGIALGLTLSHPVERVLPPINGAQ